MSSRKKCKELKRRIKNKKERRQAEDDLEKQMREDIEKNKTEPYLNQMEMKEYLVDMIFTQNYASENRKLMIQSVLSQFGFLRIKSI